MSQTNTGEVSVKLQGGLCNYMFQIAAAYAYSKRFNKKLILTTEDSVVIHKHISNYQDNILHNLEFIAAKDTRWFRGYNESGFNYNEIPNIEGNTYLSGYFQSELYFKDYEAEIKDLFSYPKDDIKDKYKDLLEKNTCFIHCRRGDYLKVQEHHPVKTINYFMKAIKQMPKDSTFVVFSDDIQWCKDNLPNIPDRFVFIEGNTDVEDFTLMTLCKNGIITNSTYSWWAAYLIDNANKIVVSPNHLEWFGPASAHNDTKNLLPVNWIEIK